MFTTNEARAVKITRPPLSASISPLSASVCVGQSVTFTSTASGGYPPYNYQWYLNGNPVAGATSNTWAFTSTTSGIYYVYLKVTDAKANTAQSETARTTVVTVPVGGYSIPIERPATAQPVLLNIALIATLTVIFKIETKNQKKTLKDYAILHFSTNPGTQLDYKRCLHPRFRKVEDGTER